MNTGAGHVILMGLRGAGKSSVGRLLARALSRPFADLDELTAATLNAPTPADALRTLGEPAFRQGEARALRAALAHAHPRVLALGGGTPTWPDSADMLRDHRAQSSDLLVYLHAAPAALMHRLEQTDLSQRPALLGNDPLAEVATLYDRRDPLYRQLADLVVDTAQESPEQTAERVARLLAKP